MYVVVQIWMDAVTGKRIDTRFVECIYIVGYTVRSVSRQWSWPVSPFARSVRDRQTDRTLSGSLVLRLAARWILRSVAPLHHCDVSAAGRRELCCSSIQLVRGGTYERPAFRGVRGVWSSSKRAPIADGFGARNSTCGKRRVNRHGFAPQRDADAAEARRGKHLERPPGGGGVSGNRLCGQERAKLRPCPTGQRATYVAI